MPYKDPEKARAAKARYYQRNIAQVKAVARDRRNLVVRYIQEYKQTRGCVDCKIMYPYWILEFDHLPEFEKVKDVSRMVRGHSLEEVKAEIAKCDVVCANCHKDRSHARITKNTGGAIRLEPDTPC